MKKYDDSKVCVMCDYYDPDTVCSNPRGKYRNLSTSDVPISEVGCDRFKQWKEDKAEEPKKPSYGNWYIDNPWSEWQKKAYKKGMIHE